MLSFRWQTFFTRFSRRPIRKDRSEGNEPTTSAKKMLFFRGYRGKTLLTLEEQFLGFIPDSTKERIAEALQIFGDYKSWSDETEPNIYIIKEAVSWQRVVPAGDPLVIGVRGKQAYLIDQFDTTPIERYVVDEFCTGREGE